MNFFGHAVIASELFAAPEVALGAMLPDLLAMVGSTASEFRDEGVRLGIGLHHATDAAFHEGAHFTTRQEEARTFLRALPIRRGPRRAVAHVGVELVLDAALNGPERLDKYRRSLQAGLERRTLLGVPFADRLRLVSLLRTLLLRSAHVTPGSPAGVVERLDRALGSRAILRLAPEELPHVLAWATTAWEPIHRDAEGWLKGLKECLARPTGDLRPDPQSSCAPPR